MWNQRSKLSLLAYHLFPNPRLAQIRKSEKASLARDYSINLPTSFAGFANSSSRHLGNGIVS